MLESFKRYHVVGWCVCALAAVFYCYEYFLRIMPSVMTTQLMQAFDVHATMVGSLAAFYYYAYTPMQIPVGIMMDRYGPRNVLIMAILVCGAGVELFGTSGHYSVAALGRFMIGFGSAFGFVGVLKIATMWLPPKRFALVSGLTMTLAMLGAMFGSVYLERLVRLSGWQATIKISVIGAFILAAIFVFTLPTRNPQQESSIAHEAEISYVQLIANVWYLVKNPVIWLNGFVGCLLYLSLSVFAELWGPKYLEVAHHLSSQQAVGVSSMIFLAWAIGSPIIGSLAIDFKRSVQLMMLGAIVTAVASLLLLTLPALSPAWLKVVLFIFALGSSAQILVFNVARMTVKKQYSGTAIAFTNMLVMLGGSVFEPLVGKFLDVLWKGGVSEAGARIYTANDFNLALSVLPVGAAICLMLLFFIQRRQPKYMGEIVPTRA